jgi:hypothetical protein
MARSTRWSEKLPYIVLIALGVGLASLWQYSKYQNGHGLAYILGGKVSPLVELLIFVGLPVLFVVTIGWRAVTKDLDSSL